MNSWQNGIPNNAWDESLMKHGGHFTQTSHWAAVQEALGNKVFYNQGDDWQCLAIIERGKLATRVYAPYGPTAGSEAALELALAELAKLAKSNNAAYVRIDPIAPLQASALKSLGLKKASKDVQPSYTWVQDLTKSDDELMADMSSTNRNLYRTASKKGLLMKASTDPGDIKYMIDMIHEVALRNNIRPHSDEEFKIIARTLLPRGAGKIYTAFLDGKPVASALTYDSPTTRYYAHAGAFSEYRKLHPGSPLLSTMIFDAKSDGQKQFDFFGIAPPDQPNHAWAGFSSFKRSFGGDYKPFLGTWELPVNKLRFSAYKAVHGARKLLKR